MRIIIFYFSCLYSITAFTQYEFYKYNNLSLDELKIEKAKLLKSHNVTAPKKEAYFLIYIQTLISQKQGKESKKVYQDIVNAFNTEGVELYRDKYIESFLDQLKFGINLNKDIWPIINIMSRQYSDVSFETPVNLSVEKKLERFNRMSAVMEEYEKNKVGEYFHFLSSDQAMIKYRDSRKIILQAVIEEIMSAKPTKDYFYFAGKKYPMHDFKIIKVLLQDQTSYSLKDVIGMYNQYFNRRLEVREYKPFDGFKNIEDPLKELKDLYQKGKFHALIIRSTGFEVKDYKFVKDNPEYFFAYYLNVSDGINSNQVDKFFSNVSDFLKKETHSLGADLILKDLLLAFRDNKKPIDRQRIKEFYIKHYSLFSDETLREFLESLMSYNLYDEELFQIILKELKHSRSIDLSSFESKLSVIKKGNRISPEYVFTQGSFQRALVSNHKNYMPPMNFLKKNSPQLTAFCTRFPDQCVVASENPEELIITLKKGNKRISFTFKADPGVIEVVPSFNSISTMDDLIHFEDLIQKFVFDQLSSLGLRPTSKSDFASLMHTNIDVTDMTNRELRNFIVDFLNHPFLSSLSKDYYNASFPINKHNIDQIKAFLEKFDNSGEEFLNSKDKSILMQGLGQINNKSMIRMNKGSGRNRIELRFTPMGATAEECNSIMDIFYERKKFIQNKQGLIPFKGLTKRNTLIEKERYFTDIGKSTNYLRKYKVRSLKKYIIWCFSGE